MFAYLFSKTKTKTKDISPIKMIKLVKTCLETNVVPKDTD